MTYSSKNQSPLLPSAMRLHRTSSQSCGTVWKQFWQNAAFWEQHDAGEADWRRGANGAALPPLRLSNQATMHIAFVIPLQQTNYAGFAGTPSVGGTNSASGFWQQGLRVICSITVPYEPPAFATVPPLCKGVQLSACVGDIISQQRTSLKGAHKRRQ